MLWFPYNMVVKEVLTICHIGHTDRREAKLELLKSNFQEWKNQKIDAQFLFWPK